MGVYASHVNDNQAGTKRIRLIDVVPRMTGGRESILKYYVDFIWAKGETRISKTRKALTTVVVSA